MQKNIAKVLASMSATDKASLLAELAKTASPKTATAKKVEYEYGIPKLIIPVRAKGSKAEFQAREIALNPLAKSALNYHIFSPASDSGVLISRKGVYLPKSNQKVERAS